MNDPGVSNLWGWTLILFLIGLAVLYGFLDSRYTKLEVKCKVKSKKSFYGLMEFVKINFVRRRFFTDSIKYRVFIRASTPYGKKLIEIGKISTKKGENDFLNEMLKLCDGNINIPIAQKDIYAKIWRVKLKDISYLPGEQFKDPLDSWQHKIKRGIKFRQGVYSDKNNPK